MAYKIIKKKMYDCTCERCPNNWITDKLPNACSRCKSTAWNKIKKESERR